MNSYFRMSLERLLDSIISNLKVLPKGTTVLTDGAVTLNLIHPKPVEICNFTIYHNGHHCGSMACTKTQGAYFSLSANLDIDTERELFEFFPIATHTIRKAFFAPME